MELVLVLYSAQELVSYLFILYSHNQAFDDSEQVNAK